MDIVAYSQLPMDDQTRLIAHLQQIVRATDEFTQAKKRHQLLRLPTGDGVALVFFGDAEAPARCALEISKALREQPDLKLRMGIHAGPVQRLEDINANRNVAGGGINLAQRVMDCGDAGHILLSKSVADVLSQMSRWKGMLHDLGEAKVKHDVTVHLYNLYTEETGNRELPQKLVAAHKVAAAARAKARRKKFSLALTAAGIAAVLGVAGFFYLRRPEKLSNRDTVILADFTNKTGDEIFDDTLKTALTVSLNQSPFLNMLSDSNIAKTLKLMTRPRDTKLTPEVAREVCQRAGSKAYIAGSIASLGSQYVLGLRVVNCQSGDTLAQEQATAAAKEKVLDTLGEEASRLRGELGESLASVQQFDMPLAHATTSSLEALKQYSFGDKAYREKGAAAELIYNQRAIQLDPDFASAYEAVGDDYFSMGELGHANEYFTKAFQLRDHASERERLSITANYYQMVTGQLEKAAQTYEETIASYPRDTAVYNNLGNVYAGEGQYEKAAEAYRESLALASDNPYSSGNLANSLMAMQRFDEAHQTIQQTQGRKLDNFELRNALYALAFLRGDPSVMAEQQQWSAGRPEENFGLSLASDTEGYAGHLGKARELTQRSVDSAIRSDSKENGAIWLENAALREAAFGNMTDAKQIAERGLKLVSTSQSVEAEAALAYAMAGEVARAQSMAQDLNKRYPLDTQMQSLLLPAVRAQLALNQRNPALALNTLQAASAMELGQLFFVANLSCLYPTYIRGEAYLAAAEGKEAAAEFQKILDHSGIVWNCWTGALAHLGVARADALQSEPSHGADAAAARTRALAAYKEFFTLWKDADLDIPILKEAKTEYAKLQ